MQLFVNDAQINSSNILSGNGVIHGLTAVLQINRNRCDEAKYRRVLVNSPETCTCPQTHQLLADHPLLFLHREAVWTVCSLKAKSAPTPPS